MLTPRLQRRLRRHHLPLILISAVGLVIGYAVVHSPNAMHRWSMSTAYVGLALIVVTLIIGPLNLLRGRANPVSIDLRRDIGIWAGLISIAHFVIGLQVHMKHRYLYWFTDSDAGGALRPRTDIFGFANDTGLAAVELRVLRARARPWHRIPGDREEAIPIRGGAGANVVGCDCAASRRVPGRSTKRETRARFVDHLYPPSRRNVCDRFAQLSFSQHCHSRCHSLRTP